MIVDGDPFRRFGIGFTDGRIFLNGPVDREKRAAHELTVAAFDLSRPSAVNATALVVVEIVDSADEAPQFERDLYEFQMSEGAVVGTQIGSVRAVDRDASPQESPLVYAITNGNRTVMSVDPNSGVLHLIGGLDFEAARSHEWTITARDADGQIGQTVVRLEVRDENDSPVEFVDRAPLRLQIEAMEKEEEDGRFVHHLRVVDADSVSSLPEQDGDHVFSLNSGDNSLFSVDRTTGILRLKRPLDPQDAQRLAAGEPVERKLVVSASDGLFAAFLPIDVTFRSPVGQLAPLRFQSLIQTIGINENRPTTNRTAIETLRVKGGRRPFVFSTPPTNTRWPLQVNAETGHVFLVSALDRRAESKFVVPFQVVDADGQAAFCQTIVSVLPAGNKHAPKFVGPESGYEAHVSIQAASGDRIAQVHATDGDADDQLEYTMVDFDEDSPQNPLKFVALDSRTGLLTMTDPIPANLAGPRIDFFVLVADSSNPPHSQKRPFRLHITEAPVPQFARLHFVFAIPENATQGTIVGRLSVAGDQEKNVAFDSAAGGPFAVEKESGKLIVRRPLDRETADRHEFVASIRDAAGRGSFALITVNVLDVNDEKPTFRTLVDRVRVREDVQPNSIVAAFNAVDRDEGPNGRVAYALKPTDDAADFRVDREFGWLLVAGEGLDFERKQRYNLTIVASYQGGLSTERAFVVEVLDVNDSPITFEKKRYEVRLDERNARLNQAVLRLNVNDADSSAVQNISISLSGRKHGDLLRLDERNVVVNKRPVEFASFNETFDLIASDGLFNDHAQLLVVWKAADGHSCPATPSELHVLANLTAGTPVWRFENETQDELLIHHLIGAESLPFEIVNNSALVVNDEYFKMSEFELRLKSIRQRPEGEHTCVQRMRIVVDEASREAPHFELRNHTIHVNENETTAAASDRLHFLLRLEATDGDFGQFGGVSLLASA
ncbi:hypothetical protein M3Y99_00051000 [Aphelenchoides fujianensis]|nr:hypothetical protein M3Y99_00051000 [Aphelenchoides fujianensis]